MAKRFVEYDKEQIKDSLQSFLSLNKERAIVDDKLFKDNAEDSLEFVKRIEDFSEIIINNGFDVQTQKNFSMRDLSLEIEKTIKDYSEKTGKSIKDFSASSLGVFSQQILNRVVTKIQYNDFEAWQYVSKDMLLEDSTVFYTVVIGEEGSPTTARVAESGEFKTINLESTEDFIKTSKGKVGVMVAYSQEALERNGLALINTLLSAAINDMKRYKSLEAIRLLEAHANTALDGLSSTPTLKPSGRSFKNPIQQNGTLLLGDLEKFLYQAQNSHFNIDVIFLHPLAWNVIYKEPNIREYLKETANIRFMIPAKMETIYQNAVTKWNHNVGKAVYKTEKMEVPQLIKNKNLNIIVTPLVSYFTKGSTVYSPATRFTTAPVAQYTSVSENCTDILLCDSSRSLSYVHDGKGITVDRIEDKMVDVTKIKLKERYGFVLDKNHGVFAFRNITVTDDVYDPTANQPIITLKRNEVFN